MEGDKVDVGTGLVLALKWRKALERIANLSDRECRLKSTAWIARGAAQDALEWERRGVVAVEEWDDAAIVDEIGGF